MLYIFIIFREHIKIPEFDPKEIQVFSKHIFILLSLLQMVCYHPADWKLEENSEQTILK